MITEKTIDMLTKDSVSIKTLRFIEEEGQKYQVGGIHRCAYANSESGRKDLSENEPEDVSSTVLAFWGDTPTVSELTIDVPESEWINDI